MIDIFHERLLRSERRGQRLKNNPAPTFPKYDLSLSSGCGLTPIAHGSSTGTHLTVTVTRNLTCNGWVQLYALWGSASHVGSGQITGVSESLVGGHGSSIPWTISTSTQPAFGYAEVDTHFSATPPYNGFIEIGSVFGACVPGDLVVGDTITLTINDFHGGPSFSSGLLFAYGGIGDRHLTSHAEFQNGAVIYQNSDSRGEGFNSLGDPTLMDRLLWGTDFSSLGPEIKNPSPDADAFYMTVHGAYPAIPGGFTPADSGVIMRGQENGAASLVVGTKALQRAGVGIEPGGFWASSADLLVGNYQYARFM